MDNKDRVTLRNRSDTWSIVVPRKSTTFRRFIMKMEGNSPGGDEIIMPDSLATTFQEEWNDFALLLRMRKKLRGPVDYVSLHQVRRLSRILDLPYGWELLVIPDYLSGTEDVIRHMLAQGAVLASHKWKAEEQNNVLYSLVSELMSVAELFPDSSLYYHFCLGLLYCNKVAHEDSPRYHYILPAISLIARKRDNHELLEWLDNRIDCNQSTYIEGYRHPLYDKLYPIITSVHILSGTYRHSLSSLDPLPEYQGIAVSESAVGVCKSLVIQYGDRDLMRCIHRRIEEMSRQEYRHGTYRLDTVFDLYAKILLAAILEGRETVMDKHITNLVDMGSSVLRKVSRALGQLTAYRGVEYFLTTATSLLV